MRKTENDPICAPMNEAVLEAPVGTTTTDPDMSAKYKTRLGVFRFFFPRRQCEKIRVPVRLMTSPCLSHMATVSASRMLPPG